MHDEGKFLVGEKEIFSLWKEKEGKLQTFIKVKIKTNVRKMFSSLRLSIYAKNSNFDTSFAHVEDSWNCFPG